MFDSLDEQMRLDEHKAVSNKERTLRWLLIAIVSIVIFVGLYYAMHLLET